MKFEDFLNESKQKDQVMDLINPMLDVKGAPSADDLAKRVEKMGQHYRTQAMVDERTAKEIERSLKKEYKAVYDDTNEDGERKVEFEPVDDFLITIKYDPYGGKPSISMIGKMVKALKAKGGAQASGPEAAFTKLAKTVLPGGKGTTVDTKGKTFSARWSTNKGLSGPEKQISKIVSNAESAGFKLDKTNNVDSPDGNVSGYDSTYKRQEDGASLEIRVRIGGGRNTFEAELTADPKKMK